MTSDGQNEQRAAPKRRVIAFFGLFGTGNVGNEASLSSAVLAAQRIDPSAELVCVCSRPDVVRAEHGIGAVPIYMAARCRMRLRDHGFSGRLRGRSTSWLGGAPSTDSYAGSTS